MAETGISNPQAQLPSAFRDLEPFADWALATEQERMAAREAGNIEEMQVFYDAMMPRLPAIIDHLKQFPPDRIPAESQRLFNMTCSLIEISIAVELYRRPQVINGFDRARFGVE